MRSAAVAVVLSMALLFAGGAWAGDEAGSTVSYGADAGKDCADNGSSFFGYKTGYRTTGSYNTFIGAEAGFSNTAGGDSVYVGYQAGYANTDGTFNNFIGSKAGLSNTTGDDNIFIGLEAGNKNKTGSFNVYIGSGAGHENDAGGNNTLVGYQAGQNATGSGNVFLGYRAGRDETDSNRLYISNSDTSSPIIYGEFDTPMVRINSPLYVSGIIQSTSGGFKFADGTTQTTAGLTGAANSQTTSLGSGAGSTGDESVFIGTAAGASNTGGYNSFLGYYAGFHNKGGEYNTFAGFQAGVSNTEGHSNSFFGYYVGGNNITGNNNSFFGFAAGYSNNGGSWNTALGKNAGLSNTAGSNNVFIGAGAGYSETGSNRLYIDNCSNGGPVCVSNPLIYGEFDNRVVQINGKLIFSSDERMKTNIEPLSAALDRVMNLKGVSYEWKDKARAGRGREMGLLAQDVEKVFPELVYTDRKGYKSLSYDKLVPALVEAIKEQQSIISRLSERLSRLEKLEAASSERAGKKISGAQ
jgi:hypothetical protein